MPKPACLTCGRFFRPLKNGICITEGMPKSQVALPGKEYASEWEAYKLWRADAWKCEGCGATIIVGWANSPYAEHYQPGFKETQQVTGADENWIYDC